MKKARIIMEKSKKSYFKNTNEILDDAQWAARLRRIAEKVLAKNGWEVSIVEVVDE